jgi:hypothetical protein
MTENWEAFFESENMTEAEKDYIFDFQFHHAGSFMETLYKLIHLADEKNLEKLRKGFPNEVAAVLAWTQGDLVDRATAAGITF